MKKIISLLLITFLIQSLFSQTYTPIDTANSEIRQQASKLFSENEKLFYKGLNAEYKGGERSAIKKKYEFINKAFHEDILKGQYIFDDRFDKQVNRIVGEINAANPDIPTDLKFYISRNLPLNASSFGNKVFEINLGAFYFLENEDQLAAIISHEIGHFMLKHTIKNILHQYQLKKSNDVNNQLFAIRNEKNNQGVKAYNKLKNILYEDGRLSKKQELEADSLGYEIYRRTKFKRIEYINDLRLSEMYDTIRPIGLHGEIFRKVFNLPNQPFKEEWMKKEDFSNYDYSKYKERYNEDSINSHPEIETRIALLKKTFVELQSDEAAKEGSAQFMELNKIAGYEQLPSLMFQEEYGLGVYICLLNIQRTDKDEFYTDWLGKFFEKICDARKHYTLNRYLERIDPKNQSESYQQFLSFMWNLNLTELKNISDYYTKKGS